MLRAVSLPKPEADLIASGKLAVFTRPWRTPYRGKLAIHVPDDEAYGDQRRCIVAIADLDDVREVEARGGLTSLLVATEPEIGRWLYVLGNVEPVDPPVPCTGRGSGAWRVPVDIADRVDPPF